MMSSFSRNNYHQILNKSITRKRLLKIILLSCFGGGIGIKTEVIDLRLKVFVLGIKLLTSFCKDGFS